MFINASQDSRSLEMVDLRYVFNLLSVLNERSHSADINVIGNVHKMRIKVWMLGMNSWSHAASVWTALVGRSASSVLRHFLFHRRSSTSTSWGEGRLFSQNSSAASMLGFLSLTATSSGKKFKRLDKTPSLVGLKYVSCLIVDGPEGE